MATEFSIARIRATQIAELLRQSLAEGLIDPEERGCAENVFSFGDRCARQIMVPRPEVVFLTTEDRSPTSSTSRRGT